MSFPSLETIVYQTGHFGPMILIAIAVFLLLEVIFISWSQHRRSHGRINERLRVQGHTANEQEALVELRRQRGLSSDGRNRLPFATLNRIITQSGLSIPLDRLAILLLGASALVSFIAYTVTGTMTIFLLVICIACLVLPFILLLLFMRRKRHKLFEGQLPEAIETMVRSLKAGHPLPVAIALVASEMPDPIGTEFGITSDEMTYGLDLDSAMTNMRERVGQSDLSFLVVAMSIQSKTGGNLAEILSNLSRMVRERARMRRKIHSLSSEGRFSAVALSIIPAVLYLILRLTTPSYFDEVSSDPLFMPAVYVGAVQWMLGVYIMRRMVNFKF